MQWTLGDLGNLDYPAWYINQKFASYYTDFSLVRIAKKSRVNSGVQITESTVQKSLSLDTGKYQESVWPVFA